MTTIGKKNRIRAGLFCLITVLFSPHALALGKNPEAYSPLKNQGSAAEEDHLFAEEEMVLPPIKPIVKKNRPLEILASTSFIADIIRHIAGEKIRLTVLIPPGNSPHDFSSSPRDLRAIEQADLIFFNGLDLEEGLMEAFQNRDKATPFIPVSAGLPILEGEQKDHEGHFYDPHFWFSPLNMIVWTENIAKSFVLADPLNQDEYEKAARLYKNKLQDLDHEVRQNLRSIPPKNRKLLLDHNFLGYYARDYDFEIVGTLLDAYSDQGEVSVQNLIRLLGDMKKHKIHSIFLGDSSSQSLQKLVKAVAQESEHKVRVIELLSDSLSIKGRRGDGYFDFIRYNTEKIVAGLVF